MAFSDSLWCLSLDRHHPVVRHSDLTGDQYRSRSVIFEIRRLHYLLNFPSDFSVPVLGQISWRPASRPPFEFAPVLEFSSPVAAGNLFDGSISLLLQLHPVLMLIGFIILGSEGELTDASSPCSCGVMILVEMKSLFMA